MCQFLRMVFSWLPVTPRVLFKFDPRCTERRRSEAAAMGARDAQEPSEGLPKGQARCRDATCAKKGLYKPPSPPPRKDGFN